MLRGKEGGGSAFSSHIHLVIGHGAARLKAGRDIAPAN